MDVVGDVPTDAQELLEFERHMAELASDIYHEAQHARDTYQAARLRAGEGWTYERLTLPEKAGGGGLDSDVAKQAIKQKMDPASAEAKVTARLADGLLPEDPKEIARLNSIHENIEKAEANLAQKEKGYLQAAARRESTQTLMNLKRMEDEARAQLEAAYRTYREQAHELEGWNAGGLITAKYEEIAAKQGVALSPEGSYIKPGPKGHIVP
jgi:hypothetical protein